MTQACGGFAAAAGHHVVIVRALDANFQDKAHFRPQQRPQHDLEDRSGDQGMAFLGR